MFARVLSLVQVVLLLITFSGTSVSHIQAAEQDFPDMMTSWYRYKEAVDFLRDRDVIKGYEDGTFKPKATINRAEFLKMVFKSHDSSIPVGGKCFTDIDEEAWYAAYVCAAKRRDIIAGYPDGTFKPDQPVNIAEALKMILRSQEKSIDEPSGDKWFEPYAHAFDDDDILARHSYLPWQPLTRERAADLIMRVIKHDEDRITLQESPGCGKALRDPPTSIQFEESQRSLLVTIPDRYRSQTPAPLIVAFHGRTNSNERVRSYYGLDRAATDAIIVYPAAHQNDNGSYSWTGPKDIKGFTHNVLFFDAIVKEVSEHYCIDMDRIYTVGHSLGAWMANTVACVRGGAVRASATVGGDSLFTTCSGPTAAFLMHNPDDTLSPFSGAEALRDMRLKANACEPESVPIDPEEFKCQRYLCDGGNPVVWCPHEIDEDENGTVYPHLWPRGTGAEIISFFNGLDD